MNRTFGLRAIAACGAMACGIWTYGPAAPAQAATVRVDVLVDDIDFPANDPGSAFSFPRIRFLNLSDPGYNVTSVAILDGFIDWIYANTLADPAGGTSTPTGTTQVTSVNQDDGCNAVSFDLTSFGAGDSFSFQVDPEPGTCTSAVVDWRTRLDPDSVTASTTVTGPGIPTDLALSGSDWTMELKDPQGSTDFTNQQYRLTMTATVGDAPVGTPEPATMALLGVGVLGLGLLRRRG